MRFEFASDNTAGFAPEAMAALAAANTGFCSGYGTDDVTRRAADLLRETFDADADVHFVATGTAANAICLAAICRPFESVLAHSDAHILVDETGAPSHFGHGLMVTGLKGVGGKLTPASVKRAALRPEGTHYQMSAALSFANPTEYGTLYTIDALRRLTVEAKTQGLATHMDGARLANAAAAGLDLKALPRSAVDVLVVGGTKAGMPSSEAILLLNSALSRRFGARLKQSGQLPSKGRYYAAPWIGMLESGAWTERARHANAMAAKLATAAPFEVAHPAETNAVFVRMDKARHRELDRLGWVAFRAPDDSVRFMCSWATTPALVEEAIEALRSIA